MEVFIDHPDVALLTTLKKQSKSRLKKIKPTEPSGIQLNEQVVLFKVPTQEGERTGLLFHLTDEDAFKKRFRHSVFIPFSNKGVGLLLDNSHPDLKTPPTKLAKSILVGAYNRFNKVLTKTEKGSLARLIVSNEKTNWTGIKKVDITLSSAGNAMNIEGDILFTDEELLKRPMPRLASGGWQFSTSIFPPLPKYWQQWLTRILGQPFPEIKSFCLNYRGIIIDTGPPFSLEPDFDVIVEFNQTVRGSTWLNHAYLKSLPGYSFTGNSCFLGNSKYTFRQLKPNRIYLGKSQHPAINTDDDLHVLKMSGSVADLLKYRGNRLVEIVMDALPGMRQLKQLAASGTEIDLRLSRLQKGGAGLSLTCSVDRKNVFWNELLKLLLTL
jgi:hypothetical protein